MFFLPRCSSSLALYFSTVPAFSEEGRQQAADHAAEEETLQEPNHPGLQDLGGGGHQHGRGTAHPPPSSFAFSSSSVAPPLTPALASLRCVTGEKALLCLASFHMTHGHRAYRCVRLWGHLELLSGAHCRSRDIQCRITMCISDPVAVASIANRCCQYQGAHVEACSC